VQSGNREEFQAENFGIVPSRDEISEPFDSKDAESQKSQRSQQSQLREMTSKTAYRVMKLLSVDPTNYPDAPREAIRRILEEVTGVAHPKDRPLDTSRIQSIRMGTTVATNALL